MLDEIGVVQHHHAITGTTKQRVADDYKLSLSEVIEGSNKVYDKLIGVKAKELDPRLAKMEWEHCQTTNSSYLDCPVA